MHYLILRSFFILISISDANCSEDFKNFMNNIFGEGTLVYSREDRTVEQVAYDFEDRHPRIAQDMDHAYFVVENFYDNWVKPTIDSFSLESSNEPHRNTAHNLRREPRSYVMEQRSGYKPDYTMHTHNFDPNKIAKGLHYKVKHAQNDEAHVDFNINSKEKNCSCSLSYIKNYICNIF